MKKSDWVMLGVVVVGFLIAFIPYFLGMAESDDILSSPRGDPCDPCVIIELERGVDVKPALPDVGILFELSSCAEG